MRINDIHSGIEGEGTTIGTPKVFIRFQGCSVGCTFCDTPEALNPKKGKEMTPLEIVIEVDKFGLKNVSLTGGNPLEQDDKEIFELLKLLKNRDYYITVECSGQDYKEWLKQCDFLSIDIKPPSSGLIANTAALKQILTTIASPIQIKTVIKDWDDYEFAKKMKQMVDKIEEDNIKPAEPWKTYDFILTPCWETIASLEDVQEWTKKLCEKVLDDKFDCRLIMQQHKMIYGPKMTGV